MIFFTLHKMYQRLEGQLPRCPNRRTTNRWRTAGTLSLQIFLLSLLQPFLACFGDSVPPAYLEVVETIPGSVDVIWKVPKVSGVPDDLAPILPSTYTIMSEIQDLSTQDSMISKWSMVGEPLSGQVIGIQALEKFTMEALIRVEQADGLTTRTVLKPNAPQLELPKVGKSNTNGLHPIAIYAGLFIAAWFLSLKLSGKKPVIVICCAALVAGSIAGDTLGNRLPKKENLSKEETKQILQGLMLNTYRAFIFEHDEEIYDILARSVEGEALGQIFLENRSRLSFNDPEAASSMVDRLDIKTIESTKKHNDGSITFLTDWDVYGTVAHWEHVHFRCNAFKAEITIIPSDGYWKITNLNILEEERVL